MAAERANGIYSHAVFRNRTTGAIGNGPVTYAAYPLYNTSLPSFPSPFGRSATEDLAYTLHYIPRLRNLMESNSATQGLFYRMQHIMQNYRFFRVKRMIITITPRPRVRVYDPNVDGDQLGSILQAQQGPEAYFACIRSSGPFVDFDGAVANVWTTPESLHNSSFSQMQLAYPTNRRRMIHVPDLNKMRPIKFSFRPTIMMPHFIGAFPNGASSATDTMNTAPINSATPWSENRPKLRPMPWMPTFFYTNPTASTQVDVTLNHISLFGFQASFKLGSWYPRAWCAPVFRVGYVFEFKGYRPPGSLGNTIAGTFSNGNQFIINGYPRNYPTFNDP